MSDKRLLHTFAALGLALFSATCSAQTVYRCGNSFQDTPCPGAPIKVQPGLSEIEKAADPEKERFMIAACEQAVRAHPGWKDPTSLLMAPVRRGKEEYRLIGNKKLPVRAYITGVNAKNSYGAYVGETFVACYANLEETELLNVYVSPTVQEIRTRRY